MLQAFHHTIYLLGQLVVNSCSVQKLGNYDDYGNSLLVIRIVKSAGLISSEYESGSFYERCALGGGNCPRNSHNKHVITLGEKV